MRYQGYDLMKRILTLEWKDEENFVILMDW